MFIKVKAQSSGFENEYIKDRNIFKKKRKSSKLLLAGILSFVIGGYFYYLASGDLNRTPVADSTSTPRENITTIKTVATNTNSDNQSQIVTETIVNDNLEDNDHTGSIQNAIADNSEPLQILAGLDEASIKSDHAIFTEEKTTEIPVVSEITNKKNNEPEILENKTNLETKLDNTEIVEQPQTIAELVQNNLKDDTDSFTDIQIDIDREELAILSNANEKEEITGEKLAAPSIENAKIPPEEFTVMENIDTNKQKDIAFEEITTPLLEQEQATENIEILQPDISGENNKENTQSEKTNVVLEEEMTSDGLIVIDDPHSNITEPSSEINQEKRIFDEQLITVDYKSAIDSKKPESITESTKANIKSDQTADLTEKPKTYLAEFDSSDNPIKVISNIISNVFSETTNDKRSFADVIEISFSDVANSVNDVDTTAVATVTHADESANKYEGSSVEALAGTTNDLIHAENLNTNITTLEVSKDVIAKINNNETSDKNTLLVEDSASIFYGVDSVSSVESLVVEEIPNQNTELVNKTEHSVEQITVKQPPETNSLDNAEPTKQEEAEPDKLVGSKLTGSTQNTIALADGIPNDKSKDKIANSITLKKLYDNLMTDLDQEATKLADIITVNKSNLASDPATIKQIKQHIATTVIAANSDQLSTAKQNEASESVSDEEIKEIKLKTAPDKSLAMVDDIPPEIVSTTTTNRSDSLINTFLEPNVANQKLDAKGNTPLMIAALNSDMQAVRELVEQGAKINTRNNWGWSTLLNATIKGNRELVDYLLKHGANPNLSDNDGRSPLMAAAWNKYPDIVNSLLNYNVDVNTANQDGWTALSFAAWNGDSASASRLLRASASTTHKTSEGLTPLQLAKKRGHTEVIELLK